MLTDVQTLVAQVLSLPAPSREEILNRLIESLDALDVPSSAEQAEIDNAWSAEVTRRVQAIRSGEAELLDGEATLRDIRNKFGV